MLAKSYLCIYYSRKNEAVMTKRPLHPLICLSLMVVKVNNLTKLLIISIISILILSCADSSRRAEIEARKAALKQKQDSALTASQQELAATDSLLQAVNRQYEQMKIEVEQHKAQLHATEEELTTLTRLRMYRDSLQTQWQALGAKIKYIRQQQSKSLETDHQH